MLALFLFYMYVDVGTRRRSVARVGGTVSLVRKVCSVAFMCSSSLIATGPRTFPSTKGSLGRGLREVFNNANVG